jgi:integrase
VAFFASLPRDLKRVSKAYFFWSGYGDPQSQSKHISSELLKLYRAAGIPERWQGGPRSHEFRDTTALMLLERPDGSLEDAQFALGHDNPNTTAKSYIDKQRTAKMYEEVNRKKQEEWSKVGMWQ